MAKVLCGVDIGGTKCSIALINEDGKILDNIYTCAHVEKGEEGMIDMIAGHVKELLHRNQMKDTDLPAIGVGCAGHIRHSDGVIITTSNLEGFNNYPLRDAMQSHFKVPVILDNDANAQAFGEYKFGAGQAYDDMIFVTISTGIGAGIVIKMHGKNSQYE